MKRGAAGSRGVALIDVEVVGAGSGFVAVVVAVGGEDAGGDEVDVGAVLRAANDALDAGFGAAGGDVDQSFAFGQGEVVEVEVAAGGVGLGAAAPLDAGAVAGGVVLGGGVGELAGGEEEGLGAVARGAGEAGVGGRGLAQGPWQSLGEGPASAPFQRRRGGRRPPEGGLGETARPALSLSAPG